MIWFASSLGQHFHLANVDFYFVEGIGKKMWLDTHVSAIDSADTAGIDWQSIPDSNQHRERVRVNVDIIIYI